MCWKSLHWQGGSSALQDNAVIVNLPFPSVYFARLEANRCGAKQAVRRNVKGNIQRESRWSV